MTTKRRTTWKEKLHKEQNLPRVEPITGRMSKRWGTGTFVIPAPLEVDAAMRRVRWGRLTTIDDLRKLFAARHGASIGCPITTGIFAWVAAHAADEAQREGAVRITPYWRTLKTGGQLNPKYPGGIENVRARLEDEGHAVVQKGKRFFVADYASSLAKLRP